LAADAALATYAGMLRSNDGTKLAYRAWPLEGATLTFAVVHGLGEHGGRYERFARGMARHNMATFAVDLRGHGQSEGPRGHVDNWSQWVEDAAAFVAHVEQQTQPTEVVPLGHSFGGAITLTTVRTGKVPHARRFVLSSPALRVKTPVPAWKKALAKVAARLAPTFTLDNEVAPETVSRIAEVVEAYRSDPLVHSKISARTYDEWVKAAAANIEHAQDIEIPFLVLAGTADPLIDPAGSEELHRHAAARSELRLLEGRYHEPFNDIGADEVFDLIAEWLNRR
jgi:alpha-beta hydrolase superfamily lysophospholipase